MCAILLEPIRVCEIYVPGFKKVTQPDLVWDFIGKYDIYTLAEGRRIDTRAPVCLGELSEELAISQPRLLFHLNEGEASREKCVMFLQRNTVNTLWLPDVSDEYAGTANYFLMHLLDRQISFFLVCKEYDEPEAASNEPAG